MPPAPLYLWTLWRYTNHILLFIFGLYATIQIIFYYLFIIINVFETTQM